MKTESTKLHVSLQPTGRRGPFLLTIVLILLISAGCGSSRLFRVPEPIPDDRRAVPEPRGKEVSIVKDVLEKQFFDQVEQSFDLSRQFRNLFGRPKQAYNVDAFDEIPNSSWFTNRNHARRMTVEEIARGPNTNEGPDTSGIWTIIKAKVQGVTPGFNIEDSRGERYVIKFDPLGYSEMATGAEVVSTKLFYAAGYNVPENYIVYFHPRNLRIGDNVTFTDKKGRKRNMVEEDLQDILGSIQIFPDGRIRAAASKLLKGKAFLGPFRYRSTRKDDANDVIPHQHRRELRGLRVVAAWLNHFDTKANNSLDVYVEEDYVRHYLIDFGSTLGSNADEPQPPHIGNENSFDPHQVGINTITLGLYVRPWEKGSEVEYPSIGYYQSKGFHPQKYKFILPNPAFELTTNRDGFWGAKVVMSFTDEQIRTAVAQGQYSDPEAVAYLARTLIERRDIVGRYWFDRMNPLDRLSLRTNTDGTQDLCFVDLAVESGLETMGDAQYGYRMTLLPDDQEITEFQNIGNSTFARLPSVDGLLSKSLQDRGEGDSQRQVEITLRKKGGSKEKWSKRVNVYLGIDESATEYSMLGILREE